jgi:hypothetical protein
VAGKAGVPATGALGAAVTVTVVPRDGLAGYGQVWPAGDARPTPASNINWGNGEWTSNAVVSKIGANGKVSFYTKGDGCDAHHIVAVNDRRADRSRDILRQADTSTNDPRKWVLIRREGHQSLHTTAYHLDVEQRLERIQTQITSWQSSAQRSSTSIHVGAKVTNHAGL